jgi:hypothetical protein
MAQAKLNAEYSISRAEMLQALEGKMRKIWRAYIHCLEVEGRGDRAANLRNYYFKTYHSYKKLKRWQKEVSAKEASQDI